MSKIKLEKLYKIETELLPMITESDLDTKAESILVGISKLIHIPGMESTNGKLLETVLFLRELEQEGELYSNYEKR